MYLSPAFSKRTPEDLEFLHKIDGRTGFSLFWIDIVRPLLCKMGAKNLLEIGAGQGEHTRLLIDYCNTIDGNLIIIEPTISLPLLDIVSTSLLDIDLLNERSSVALPKIETPVDAVFLEGDLNYHTIYNDLIEIKALSWRKDIPFPTVFVKNTSWPYARRDMYYQPKDIPLALRHERAKLGMSPWSGGLGYGMINYPFINAWYEGGSMNGVLTAIEDFIKDAELPLEIFMLPVNHGLGIIYKKNSIAEWFVKTHLNISPMLFKFLETIEIARLNDIIRRLPRKRGLLRFFKELL